MKYTNLIKEKPTSKSLFNTNLLQEKSVKKVVSELSENLNPIMIKTLLTNKDFSRIKNLSEEFSNQYIKYISNKVEYINSFNRYVKDIKNSIVESTPEVNHEKVIKNAIKVYEQINSDIPTYDNMLDHIITEEKKEYKNENNLGEPISEDKETLKKFWKWFGDSQIKDESGRPIVMYHGSLSKFTTFRTSTIDFTFDAKFAFDYATQKSFDQALDEEPVLYSCYIRCLNPFDFRKKEHLDKLLQAIQGHKIQTMSSVRTPEEFIKIVSGIDTIRSISKKPWSMPDAIIDWKDIQVGQYYSKENEDVKPKQDSVNRAMIIFKNDNYFLAVNLEPMQYTRGYFDSDYDYTVPNTTKEEVIQQLIDKAKTTDFGKNLFAEINANIQYKWTDKLKYFTNPDSAKWEYGKPVEKTFYVYKVENPETATTANHYDNWIALESSWFEDDSKIEISDIIQQLGFDGYYMQENAQLNLAIFSSKQAKSISAKKFSKKSKSLNENKLADIKYDRDFVLNSETVLLTTYPDILEFAFRCVNNGQKEDVYVRFNDFQTFRKVCISLLKRFKDTSSLRTDAKIKQAIQRYDNTKITKPTINTIFNAYMPMLKEAVNPLKSDNFRKWFGYSKVVDEFDNPLVVYHATNSQFNSFDKQKAKTGIGFWFATNKKYAQEHGRNVMPVYLSLQNPFIVDEQESEAEKYYKDTIEELLTNRFSQEKLIKNGYDGLVFSNKHGYTYIVFDPSKIKSIDNNGQWNLESDNIFEAVNPLKNDNFKKWFGNSKIVDKSGKPLIVYHGTDFEFDAFVSKKSGNAYQNVPPAIYFSSSKAIANTYTRSGRILNCYIRMENPYIDDAEGKSFNDYYDRFLDVINEAYRNEYDGLIVNNLRDDKGQHKSGGRKATTYVVFEPNQVKSVDNNGQWSLESDNIFEAFESEINDNFKKWFKDSKVVDEQGNPLKVYHRTKQEFDTFDLNKSHPMNLQGKGAYFSISDDENKMTSYGHRKMICYLSIQNPFRGYNVKYPRTMFENILKPEWLDEIFFKKTEIEGVEFFYNIIVAKGDGLIDRTVDTTKILIELGFDGIDMSAYWVAFYPNQIKSIFNNGQWSSESDNIFEAKKAKSELNIPDNSLYEKVKEAIKGNEYAVLNEYDITSEIEYGDYLDQIQYEMDSDVDIDNNAEEIVNYVYENMYNENSVAYTVVDNILASRFEDVWSNLNHDLYDNNIYRAITSNSIEQVLEISKKDGVGNSWAKNYDNATSYFGGNIENEYILCGIATDKNVNWLTTFVMRMECEDEDEINLRPNAKVYITKIVDVKNNKTYPINQYFSTGEKYSYTYSIKENKLKESVVQDIFKDQAQIDGVWYNKNIIDNHYGSGFFEKLKVGDKIDWANDNEQSKQKPTKVNYEDKEIILNDNFWNWFGDSKTVDENGNPIVAYHGSYTNIEQFDKRFSGNTTGNNPEEVFYFTIDKDTAIDYSKQATIRNKEWDYWNSSEEYRNEKSFDDYANEIKLEVEENPNIHPCFIKMENPYVYDYDYAPFNYKLNYTLLSMLQGNTDYNNDYFDEDIMQRFVDEFEEYDEETDEYIWNANYDGVIFKNVKDDIGDIHDYITEYVVWNPNQIKSVYNKGMWSEYDANINETLTEGVKEIRKFYPDLSDSEVNDLINADPTFNYSKDTGNYIKWLFNMYNKGKISNDYDELHKISQILLDFTKYNRNIENKDLFSYKSIEELEQAVEKAIDKGLTLSPAQKKRHRKLLTQGDIKTVYEDDDWLVQIPRTPDASQVLGTNTRWCVSGSIDATDYFCNYDSQGKLFINKNKKTGEKYAFHFETNEYRDASNKNIDIKKFFEKYPSLEKFYKEYFNKETLTEAKEYKTGEPVSLIGYHGTMNDFDEFDMSKSNNEIYFADKKRLYSLAGYYAKENGYIIKAKINLKNPFVGTPKEFQDLMNNHYDEMIKQYDGVISINDGTMNSNSSFYNYKTDSVEKENLQKGDIVEIAVFDPSCIEIISKQQLNSDLIESCKKSLTETFSQQVVYHGSQSKNINHFNTSSIFWSTDKEFAESYGKWIYQANLDMNKTFDITKENHFNQLLEYEDGELSEPNYDESGDEKGYRTYKSYNEFYKSNPFLNSWEITEEYLYSIQSMGYDSIKVYEEGTINYAVFDNSQIKLIGQPTLRNL